MSKITIKNTTGNEITKTDGVVKFLNKSDVKESDKFEFTTFEGNMNDIIVIGNSIYVGIEKEDTDNDDWRILGFKITSMLSKMKFKTITINNVPEHSEDFIQGLYLGIYSFDKYKSKKTEMELESICLSSNFDLTKVIEIAEIKTESQILTKDWVNTTPEDAYADSIIKNVKETFNGTKVKVKVFTQDELEDLGMNGHLAVNRASRHDAAVIRLTYEPKDFKKTTILIGKTLTFDSGGLSIKPGTSMLTMKLDKAGGMAVWGIMKGISEIGSDNKVVVYMSIAENMIDGSAYKPDDIITMKNGKTVHIKNTDAEGRVVLFDSICLAEEENPDFDEMYTFATLTGAAVVQFGSEAAAMIGFNDEMKSTIKSIGENEGEYFMNAEFHKYMLNGVDDTVADLSNMGTPNQGSQKAGLFLTKALTEDGQKKFMHVDFAGPAFVKTAFGSNQSGGTGFAVRTFINYLTK